MDEKNPIVEQLGDALYQYPPGIQILLRQAGEHLAILARMALDYRAWAEAQDEPPPLIALDAMLALTE